MANYKHLLLAFISLSLWTSVNCAETTRNDDSPWKQTDAAESSPEKSEKKHEHVSRLLVSFHEDCNAVTESKRVLQKAVKHAFDNVSIDMAGQQFSGLTSSDSYFDVSGTADNSAYEENRFSLYEPVVGVEGVGFQVNANKCSVAGTHLKQVGIDIVDLEKCKILNEEIVLQEFERNTCVRTVEYDSTVSLDRDSMRGSDLEKSEVNTSQKMGKGKVFISDDEEDNSFLDELLALDSADSQMLKVRSTNRSKFYEYLANEEIIDTQKIMAMLDPYNPNDPYVSNQYHHGIVNSFKTWGLTQGNPGTIVAVIDTGMDYLHEDLVRNVFVNEKEIPGNGIDDDNNGYIDDVYGFDFRLNSSNCLDDHGHGTHVGGIIGGVGNNAVGVAGVCWNVKLAALKFMDASGSGSTSDAIKALNYAITMGIHVSCNSWGGPDFSEALVSAIDQAKRRGHLIVAAAGNQWNNTDRRPHYPASYRSANIVSVAATNQEDKLSSFSNYGRSTVHLAAPGSSILSTYRNNSYRRLSGTSMATPIVAGAAAILLSEYPELTLAEVCQALFKGVDKLDVLYGRCSTGGRLNIFRSLVIGGITEYLKKGKRHGRLEEIIINEKDDQ